MPSCISYLVCACHASVHVGEVVIAVFFGDAITEGPEREFFCGEARPDGFEFFTGDVNVGVDVGGP